eukprot:SM000039S14516  [mRNA]  locus=s39:508873:510835:- [translate_table: standard]
MGILAPTAPPPPPAAALEALEEASAAATAASSPGVARLLPRSQDASVTKLLAMDCEMVGVGRDGKRSMLARVAIPALSDWEKVWAVADAHWLPALTFGAQVNAHGNVVLDKHVRPLELVTDLRTAVSGVQWRHLNKHSAAEDFWEVQREVAGLLKGRVLVGHALHNDLKALLLSHPRRDTRDTQRYKPLRGKRGQARALRHLAAEVLGATIQQGQHSPVEDARAALYIYLHHRPAWEQSLRTPLGTTSASSGSPLAQRQASRHSQASRERSTLQQRH